VLLGATAGKALYSSSFRVGEVRGRLIDWPEPRDPGHGERAARGAARPAWVLPTTHPSAVLRSRNRQQDYEALVADLAVARQALSDG
jgi:DNA polymerase